MKKISLQPSMQFSSKNRQQNNFKNLQKSVNSIAIDWKVYLGTVEKKKKFVPSQKKYIFCHFAILDNSKNILEKCFFDQTSS
jgi:hypothetical protein